eukprot:CAMPEP_0172329058 /NCGR_PEP_ID=MMETSP1058-20130122/60674_1 /TAXON_ID=83371 /ORGANISM="Detonula confervacea, Strain CCMP 353" /LENGTH=588 /DNA_ID=CAMNT_0013046205 /DNA_START=387 /DNA_END=2153 /DNA_ORIENTATION=+
MANAARHRNAKLSCGLMRRAAAPSSLSINSATRPALIISRQISTTTSNASSIFPSHTDTVMPDYHDNPLAHAPPSTLNFSDSASAHGSKSTFEILRAIAIFNACQLPFLVKYAGTLIDLSTKVLGSTVTNAVVKNTFFAHFCAGEDSEDMKPVIDMLQQNNIGPILDYAAESESSEDGAISGGTEGIFTHPPFNQPARVYDYKSECECDRHVSIFKSCIRSVQDVSPHCGFAALKVTALGNPELLQRMSTMIVEVKNLFSKFDEKGTGLISRDEFVHCYEHHFHTDDGKLTEILEFLDPSNATGMIDYISFSQMFTPYTLSKFTLKCKNVGPLALATPSDEEVVLMKKMSKRLHTLAEEAARCGTKMLIDAEHLKYQPAIDNLVLELQQKYNAKSRTERPVIFNTYQCYLKDTQERVTTDLRRSERFDFHFAAKIVRGAYMVHERQRAREMKVPSPIHETAEDTHRCYDEVIELLLNHRFQNGPGLKVMIATHNKESIEKAVKLMDELGLGPNDSGVHFAQLYGMSDNLTFTLGQHAYNSFKYLPYGKVEEVVPYLLRRAQENSDVLGNAGSELGLLQDELKKRFLFT